MGQDTSCLTSSSEDDAFLKNEMRIYRWRADSRANTHLPRVQIPPSSLASRHRFASFLNRSRQDYLHLDDFKKEMRQTGDNLIVFEQYKCTMEDVDGVLSAPEAVYVLTTLSTAFPQLLTQFKEVVVSRHCWLVTKTGHVRAWINQDPRCNFVDPSSSELQFGESKVKAIAFKLLSEVLKCCYESADILGLFSFVREEIEQKEQSQTDNFFEFIRQRISYYSGQGGFPICTSIESALKREKLKSPSIIRAPSIPCSEVKGLNETRITGCTWDNERSTHKSRSLEVTHSQLMRGTPFTSFFEPPPFLITHTSSSSSHWQPSNFSNIIQPRNIYTEPLECKDIRLPHKNCSEEKKESQTIQNASRVVKISQSLQRTEKPKSILKMTDSNISKHQCTPSQHSSKQGAPTFSLKISFQNDPLISGNILTEEDTNVQIINNQKPSRNDYRNSNLSKGRPIGRKVSILGFQEDGERQLHAHTCHQVSSSNIMQQTVEMPWKTNKTITRLINDDTDSLVHSIGTSSDYNTSTPYSGVLTQMGRDITRKDIAISVHSIKHSQS